MSRGAIQPTIDTEKRGNIVKPSPQMETWYFCIENNVAI